VIILDKLLTGGIKFVLDKVASSVDREMNDDQSLREQLLHAQMQHELGAMSTDELAEVEREILARLREIRERREGEGGGLRISQLGDDDVRVTGIETEFTADEPFDFAPLVPAARRPAHEVVERTPEVTVTRKRRQRSRRKGRR
jgi:gas vesicle protein GvpG